MSKHTKSEMPDARAELRELLKPGEAVYTILRHVSHSGMIRAIDVYIMRNNEPLCISWAVARVLDRPMNSNHNGITVTGCGMDMGFHLVYSLGLAVYGRGPEVAALGYHTQRNGDEGPETDGGYLLEQRWL